MFILRLSKEDLVTMKEVIKFAKEYRNNEKYPLDVNTLEKKVEDLEKTHTILNHSSE